MSWPKLTAIGVVLGCAAAAVVAFSEVDMRRSLSPVGWGTSRGSTAQPSGPVTLSASVEKDQSQLKLRAKIVNSGTTDVYVFNVLWNQDPSNKQIAEPEGTYRFERNKELRVLLGLAPLPRLSSVTYRNVPYATLVRAGSSLEINRSTPLPVKEYSVYFQDATDNDFTRVVAKSLVLLVMYVESRAGMRTSPCPFDPAAVKLNEPGVWDRARTLTWRSHPMDIEVRRRTDEFDRVTLPGESPEPLSLK